MASRDKLEEFLAEPRNVIVAGIRKDGRPHVAPNWFLWDGKRFYVSTMLKRCSFLPAFIGTNSVPEVLEADDQRFTDVVNYLREMGLQADLDTEPTADGSEVALIG